MIPKNENEFNDLMIEIDNILKRRTIPIYNRLIPSFLELYKKLKVEIIFPSTEKAVAGVYNKYNLADHVCNWYDKNYAGRLKVRMAIGSGVILIRNDPWRVFFPLIFGQVYFACESDIEKYENLPDITTDGKPPVINIPNLIEDMTPEFAKQLSVSELNEIRSIFLAGLKSVSLLDMIKSKHLIKEAKIDLENAVNNILTDQAHYGQSKWASLQFSEKLLKSYLFEKTGNFPKKHNLSELCNHASNCGLTKIENNVLSQVQCSPGVRYGEEEVNLEEAVKAHYSSLRICCFAAKGIIGSETIKIEPKFRCLLI